MEIAFCDPMLAEMPSPKVKAGTMALVPHEDDEDAFLDANGESKLPLRTILCAGQHLQRELYPELSSVYAQTGDYYRFQLPDLRNLFLIGFDEQGNSMMGDVIIYYESVPKVEIPIRDIRQAL